MNTEEDKTWYHFDDSNDMIEHEEQNKQIQDILNSYFEVRDVVMV